MQCRRSTSTNNHEYTNDEQRDYLKRLNEPSDQSKPWIVVVKWVLGIDTTLLLFFHGYFMVEIFHRLQPFPKSMYIQRKMCLDVESQQIHDRIPRSFSTVPLKNYAYVTPGKSPILTMRITSVNTQYIY